MTSRRADTSRAAHAYEVEAGNTISVTASPVLVPARQSSLDLPALSLGLSSLSRSDSRKLRRTVSQESHSTRIDIAPEEQLSSFHYGRKHYRVPYVASPVHKEFRDVWIYGWTWEDPEVDRQHLALSNEDSLLCITSAGDNALHCECPLTELSLSDFDTARRHCRLA